MKHVTMQDIAQKAGVTKATVSMVINNDKRITDATRQKVLKIVKEFNYYPNESARKLAKGKSDVIAFITPRFGSPFIASILESFERRAFYHNKYVHGIQPYATRNDKVALEEILKKILYGRKADALVILSDRPEEGIVREYSKKKIPVILIENEMPFTHSVRVDNVFGAYCATKCLIEKGRKSIGFVNGAISVPGRGTNHTAMERQQGFKQALQENGMEWDPRKAIEITAYEYEEGKNAINTLLEKVKGMDAVFFAAGDILAMGAIEEMKKRGIRVPEDISVVGFDDLLAARMMSPALTTVRQPFADITALAFDMALDSIEGRLMEEKHVVLEPELMIRESA